MGTTPTRPRLALLALAVVASLLTIPAFARDDFLIFWAEDPSCVVVDGEVWLAAGRHWDYGHHVRCGIWKFDPAADRETLYQDYQLPGYVYALAQTDSAVFAAGLGLSVFDKKNATWLSLPQYDTLVADAMAVGDSLLWLATSGRGIVSIETKPRAYWERRRITMAHGLASNRVLSLFLQGDTLFAGTYRFGPERDGDMSGLGLQAVNVRTSSVRDVPLPRDSVQQKHWMVTQIFRSPEDSNALRLELWHPWAVYWWDYRLPGDKVRLTGMSDDRQLATAEAALQLPGMPTDSILRGRVRAFIQRHL